MPSTSILPHGWDRREVSRPAAVRATSTRRWHAMADERRRAGLTTRGTIPKRQLEVRILAREIDATAAAIAKVYDEMPAQVQARLLALGMSLAALRSKTRL